MTSFFIFVVSYQDENTSALMMVITSSQWLALRMTLLCSLMVAAAGYGADLVAQSPGLFSWEHRAGADPENSERG